MKNQPETAYRLILGAMTEAHPTERVNGEEEALGVVGDQNEIQTGGPALVFMRFGSTF